MTLKKDSSSSKKFFNSSLILPLYALFGFLFIYIPIFVLIIFSFNTHPFPNRWAGATWDWYTLLLQNPQIWLVVKNSFIVAITSMILSLIMGVLFVFYGFCCNLKKAKWLFYTNLLFPEMVVAVGLLAFFTAINVPFSLLTLIAGHTMLGLGYVIPILILHYQQLDLKIIEASLDLGATLNQTFFRVIIPLLVPAMIAAGLLVFIISFDDFLIAFFCSGGSSQTLPLYLFSLIRTGISPMTNALSTLLILLSSFCVLIFCFLKTKVRIF